MAREISVGGDTYLLVEPVTFRRGPAIAMRLFVRGHTGGEARLASIMIPLGSIVELIDAIKGAVAVMGGR